MIGHRQWSPCPVGIFPNQGNMLSLPDKAKSQEFKRLDDSPFGSINRKRALDSHSRFGHKGFKHRRLDLKNLLAKSLDMEVNSRLDVG